jgi:hypothetical protein
MAKDKLKKCIVSRYDESITEPPYKTIPIDEIEVYEPDEGDGGVLFASRLISACNDKGYTFIFYTMHSKDDGYDYEVVVY